ncbi:hormogonium polysaccharide biosynthesis protein HpsL [Baaleninema simplex]|uniref:hormogonium polysaccharide biosynthesis protein HpsL n=1 Tax=Baaleninema simplex TaxID=2862350 RepID=UPI00034B648B|nr:hormogonium polysaccharide biosynthesis protein HpsL [Baaleninema simplex]
MPGKKSKKSKQKKGQTPPNPNEPVLSKKELAAQKRKQAKERKELIQTFVTAAVVGGIIGIALFFVKNEKLAIAGGGGIIALWMSYKYPFLALWVFIIYMPFAGTITYWIGGGNALFQLAKDGFAFPAIFAIWQILKKQRKPFIIPKSLKTPLTILMGILAITFLGTNVAQQFSDTPGEQPIAMGILGFKVFLGYLPLITCTYHLLKDKKDFLRFTRLHVILVIICCFLGLVQYMMLSSGICKGTDHLTGDDLFKATLDAKCLVGGSLVFSPSQNMIRLPGTFVAPWQWAWFLIGNIFFTFASAFSDPSLIWQLISFLGMAFVFINAVISGQRIALLLVPTITIILLVLTGQLSKPQRSIPIVGGIGVLIVLGMILFPDVIQGRIESTVSRWQASPPTEFIAHQAEFTSKGQSGILGHGLGRATNSARMFGDTALIETYYPKLLYEIGPIGVLGFLGVVTSITISSFKIWRSLKEKHFRSYAACFWVFIFFISYQTYYYPLDVDPVAVYYWMVVGAMLRLPELEEKELERLAALEELEDQDPKQRKKKARQKKVTAK